MNILLGLYLVGLTITVALLIRSDAVHQRCQFFSTRNFFLLGLALFQSISGVVTLFTGETERRAHLGDQVFAPAGFCVILTLFVILFLFFYRKAEFVERFAAARTRLRVDSQGRLALAGILLTAIGIVLRFAAANVPYVAVLLPQLAAGCLCGGAALVAMAWGRSAWNFFLATVLLATVATSSAVLLVGAFGRREILGLLFAVVWGLYHEKWRLMPATKFIPRVSIAMLALSAVVLVFSSSRVGGENVDRSLAQQLERMFTIDPRSVQENVVGALSGQFAGGISMWIFEERWISGGYVPLHSLVYLMTLPVPRDFWAGKPEGLGLTVVGEAGVTGVSAEHSWGPGLVGHLSHDVVFISLPLYALLLAWAFRYMDGRIRFAGRDPMTIALFGSALGQIIAMPRGDIGLFAFNMLAAFSGVWIFGRLVALALLPIDREAEYEMAWEGPEPSDDLDPDEEAMAQASEEEREFGSRVPGSQELGSMQPGPAR